MSLRYLLLENKIKDKLVYLLDKHKDKFLLSKEELEEFVVDYILQIDPTPQKKYVKWMILKAFDSDNIRRIKQDWVKYNEYLITFYNNRKNPNMKENDIMKIESWSELKKIVEPFMEPDEQDWKSVIEDLEEGEDYETIVETNKHKLLTILTQKGASYLGGDTEWCTTYGEYCLNPDHKRKTSNFPEAIEEGKVYLLWSKDDDKRWQFQSETGQYMNEDDVQNFGGILEQVEDDEVIKDELYEILNIKHLSDIVIFLFKNGNKKQDGYIINFYDIADEFLGQYNIKSQRFIYSFSTLKKHFKKNYNLSSIDVYALNQTIKHIIKKLFNYEIDIIRRHLIKKVNKKA